MTPPDPAAARGETTPAARAPIDPQIKALNDALPGGLALPLDDPVAARELFRNVNMAMGQNAPAADLASTEDLEVPGANGPLRARHYRPHAEGALPTLLFVHGGGFAIGDIDAYDLQARTLSEKAGIAVLSVDYRLAPEDPFPAGVEDVLSIARWTLANTESLGADPARVGIGGDSAGGNLSAVTALALRDESPGFAAQFLLYPVIDFEGEYASRDENADGPLLTARHLEVFRDYYVSADHDPRDARLSPLLAEDLTGLPPAVVVTAGYDPLRDEGDAYAEALAAVGVPVEHLRYESLIHGFFGLGPLSAGAAEAVDECCAAVRRVLQPNA